MIKAKLSNVPFVGIPAAAGGVDIGCGCVTADGVTFRVRSKFEPTACEFPTAWLDGVVAVRLPD